MTEVYELSQISRRRIRHTKQISSCGRTNIRRHRTEFIRLGYLVSVNRALLLLRKTECKDTSLSRLETAYNWTQSCWFLSYFCHQKERFKLNGLFVQFSRETVVCIINPLNPELNPICYLLALLVAHHFLHVSRIRFNY